MQDCTGRELEVGDIVAGTMAGVNIEIFRITGFSPRKARLYCFSKIWQGREHLKSSEALVLLCKADKAYEEFPFLFGKPKDEQ